jgi:hypothetical protein
MACFRVLMTPVKLDAPIARDYYGACNTES